MTNPLHKLQQLGQWIWLDSIQRSYLEPGAYLPRLVDQREINGLTSNPTIFEQALGKDHTYDEQLTEMKGADPRDALWSIMKSDVKAACDLFRPIYESADGDGGYVSIELDPSKAFDTEESVADGLMLYGEIDRPNLMVKVPGTEAGLAAITRLLAAGVNVNVTLLFSVARYEAVMEAFLAGIRRRLDANEPVEQLASVASFFVSRVDSKVDRLLGDDHPAVATAGIANARVAYASFERTFGGPQWQELVHEGARCQRPLWASTSVKNPAYRDVLYVEELAGPDTVNTMPESTLEATRDHAEVEDRISGTGDEARQQLQRLAEEGVDLEQITKELETEGVEKFVASFDAAVAEVAKHV